MKRKLLLASCSLATILATFGLNSLMSNAMRSKTKSSRAHSASVDSNLKTSLITPITPKKRSLLDQVKKRKKLKRYLLSVRPNTGADTVAAMVATEVMAGEATAATVATVAGVAMVATVAGVAMVMLTTHGDEFSN